MKKKCLKLIVLLCVVAAFAILPTLLADKWSYLSSKGYLKNQRLEDDDIE